MADISKNQHQSEERVEFLRGENQRLREMLSTLEEELSQIREDNSHLKFRTEHLEEIVAPYLRIQR